MDKELILKQTQRFHNQFTTLLGTKEALETRLKDYVGPVNGGDRYPFVQANVDSLLDLLLKLEDLQLLIENNGVSEAGEVRTFTNPADYLAYMKRQG